MKFRTYNKQTKLLSRPFTFGDLSGYEGEANCAFSPDEELTANGEINENLIFQQYIGLKDKNGIEIYTGDLVNFTIPGITHGPEREDYTNQEVIFDPEIASFAFGENSMTILGDRISEKSLEIVGNIFHE